MATVEPDGIVKGYLDRAITLRIEHAGDAAFYRPSDDLVRMPHPATFESPEAYRSTLFHELAHSTGHAKRLNRFTEADQFSFSSASYSREELVAEMAACFLCQATGINRTLENSAAYLGSWLRVLRQPRNARLIVESAGVANKAADLVLGRTREDASTE